MNLNKSKIQKSVSLNIVHFPETYEEILNESEIMGIILGDGYLGPYYARLKVIDKDFVENFSNLIQNTYKIKAPIIKRSYYECYVTDKLIRKRFKELLPNKSVPGFVINGDSNIKARFIRGFSDSEGCVDCTHNRRQIVITQLNLEILKILQKMFLDLKIQSKLVIKKNNCPQLIISLLENLQKYHDLISFSIGYKQKKLEEAINYLKKDKAHDKEKYWQVLRHWKPNGKSLRSSAKKFDMHWETYRSWVYGMKMPCQIKKDIEVGWVPKDYDELRQNYSFLPKIDESNHL